MTPHNAAKHACWHCGRVGVRGYIKVYDSGGYPHWICAQGNACLRRWMVLQ